MIKNENIKRVFELLNDGLKEKDLNREFTIFGSSALLAQNIASPDRATYDVDILDPEIDIKLQTVSFDVAAKAGLDVTWLNSAGFIFARNFPENWDERSIVVFEGSNLKVRSLSRSDLIASKMLSYCQRLSKTDLIDLKSLQPTNKEIKFITLWIKERPDYNAIEDNFNNLKKELQS